MTAQLRQNSFCQMNQKKLLTPQEGAVFWGKIEDLGGSRDHRRTVCKSSSGEVNVH